MQIKIFIYTENYILVDKDSFWPHHLKTHENVYALLILDNCSAHKHLYDSDLARKFVLPDNLCIIFLPLNLTSCIEPADMGIIEVFKVVCKLFIIRSFLAAYEDQTFTDIDTAQKRQKRGCKGLTFGGKYCVLDAAEILNQIWSLDEKYTKTTSINNCWKNLVS